MKQATVKLPSGEFCFQEVPAPTDDMFADYYFVGTDNYLYANYGQIDIPVSELLPPGSWQLLGADPTALTEEEAGEIVGIAWYANSKKYKNYLCKSIVPSKQYGDGFDTPTASLDSLAGSLGISKPFVVLKNKNDDSLRKVD